MTSRSISRCQGCINDGTAELYAARQLRSVRAGSKVIIRAICDAHYHAFVTQFTYYGGRYEDLNRG